MLYGNNKVYITLIIDAILIGGLLLVQVIQANP